MDGELKYIHVSWIPAIPAGMTVVEMLVYNNERGTEDPTGTGVIAEQLQHIDS